MVAFGGSNLLNLDRGLEWTRRHNSEWPFSLETKNHKSVKKENGDESSTRSNCGKISKKGVSQNRIRRRTAPTKCVPP